MTSDVILISIMVLGIVFTFGYAIGGGFNDHT